MNTQNTPTRFISWQKSLLWLILAAGCFQGAYASIHHPVAGLLIFGYAYGLVQLTNQPTVRRAFYFGLAAGYLSYAPQSLFMWKIFGPLALVLWLVLAFWVGLFTAMVCGCNRRWGSIKTAWLIPVIWTGVEYFRSELYYLKFSWLNIGYALPVEFGEIGWIHPGMYGLGFLIFAVIASFPHAGLIGRSCTDSLFKRVLIVIGILIVLALLLLPALSNAKLRSKSVTFVGIQMEFPGEHILPKMLDKALARNTNAAVFVLSEYTLESGVPEALKDWCRDHQRYLVVGGKDLVTNDVYYNTAFVIGTNGDIVFKQAKSVPIQFFHDGLPAEKQELWESPWGKIGICICYDLSYTRVTDPLVEQGALLLIVPTMDVSDWGRHQHELHSRVAPVRAAEYGIPIFRVASSGISQAVNGSGNVVAQTSVGSQWGDFFGAAQLAAQTKDACRWTVIWRHCVL